MRFFAKRSALLSVIVVVGLVLVGCGSSSTPPTTSGATPTPSSTPTGSSTTPTTAVPTATATTQATTVVVGTATVTFQGVSTTVLTDSRGFTLYYYTPDTPTSIACTGGCAQNWPPLTFSGTGPPTSSSPLPGTLSVYNGQVEYQGHPLYTFAGDTAPGQTNGQGLGGKFYVATPNLQANQGGQPGY